MLLPQKWRLLAITTSFLLALPSTALPKRDRHGLAKYKHDSSDLSNLQPPLTNGSSSLPPPQGKLKAITLGLGTQNYTCKSLPPSSAPKLIGANATLFDLIPFLPYLTPLLPRIPGKTLSLNISTSQIGESLCTLGDHIFNDEGVPIFHLGDVGDMLAKKIAGGDIEAPKDNSDGEATVDWLKLGDKGGSQGVDQVYRVNTAGGKPPPKCEGEEESILVPYAALYWFYEG